MIRFIDTHRQRFGVEPICRALQVAPSGYWRDAARRRYVLRLPARAQRDALLRPHIERVWNANLRVYGAFIIDVFSRYIVGWRVSSTMRTDFVLDALEQALYARKPQRDGALIHHSDRGLNT